MLESDQGELGHHRLKVCVPHPDKSQITGSLYRVIEGAAPVLGEWAPLLFRAWLVRENSDEQGAIDSEIALDKNYMVQEFFGSGSSTGFPADPELGVDECIQLPAISEAVDEYGILTAPR